MVLDHQQTVPGPDLAKDERSAHYPAAQELNGQAARREQRARRQDLQPLLVAEQLKRPFADGNDGALVAVVTQESVDRGEQFDVLFGQAELGRPRQLGPPAERVPWHPAADRRRAVQPDETRQVRPGGLVEGSRGWKPDDLVVDELVNGFSEPRPPIDRGR